jgi:branched-chain amino acid transport system substrate-binding protein
MIRSFIKNILYFIIISALFFSAYKLLFEQTEVPKDGKEIKIGLIAPLTGSNQNGGLSMKNGVELAVNKINQSGGISGIKLSLVVYDDRGIPAETVKAAKQLIFIDNVEEIIGPFSSNCCLAVKGLINSCGVPLITPIAMADEINQENDYIFRNTLGATIAQQKINAFANGMKSEYIMLEGFGARTFGILWQNDAWGSEMQQLVQNDLKAQGREDALVFSEPFEFDQNSYQSVFNKYQNHYPDLIYIISSGKESIQLVKDARDCGFAGLLYGEGGFNYSGFDKELGSYADGCLFSTQWHPSFSTPMSDVFLKSYISEYGDIPNMFSAISYEAVYILKDSLLRVIAFLPKDNFRDILNRDLSRPKKIDGITGPIYFDDKGQCDRPMFILQKRWDGRNIQSFIIYPKKYSQSEIKWNFDQIK